MYSLVTVIIRIPLVNLYLNDRLKFPCSLKFTTERSQEYTWDLTWPLMQITLASWLTGKSDHSLLVDGTRPQLPLPLHFQTSPSVCTGWTLTSLSSSSLIHTDELAFCSLSYNSSPTVCWIQLLTLTSCVPSRAWTYFYCIYNWCVCTIVCAWTSLWS